MTPGAGPSAEGERADLRARLVSQGRVRLRGDAGVRGHWQERGTRAVGCCCRWLVGRCACGLSGERERVASGQRGASRWEARLLAGGSGKWGAGRARLRG